MQRGDNEKLNRQPNRLLHPGRPHDMKSFSAADLQPENAKCGRVATAYH